MSSTVLRVDDVHKMFARVQAVGGVSFDVRRGEIFALLGPNGAGKTTLTRMILDIIRPDRGEIAYYLDGDQPHRPRRAHTGYLPEDRGLYKDIPILRTLTYFGELRGMSPRDARTQAQRWLERFDLRERGAAKLDTLSKGNQQKVQFIASILHRPALALLDEPFSGFDPVNQELLLDVLDELRADGVTILLSAHQMHLVERVADRVLLMSRGKTVLYGALDDIRRQDGAALRLTFEYSGAADVEVLAAHPAVASAARLGENRVALRVRAAGDLGELLAFVGRALRVTAVHSERLTLHDIYLRAVGEPPREPAPPAAAAVEVAS